MWGEVLGFISKPITTWIQGRNEINVAKHQRDLAVINNQARLATEKQEYNAAWEMASLQDKDKGLRWFSFILFTFPIVIMVVAPNYGLEVFARLESVPEWMMQIWFYMISGVWGIAILKDAVPQIVAGFRKKD